MAYKFQQDAAQLSGSVTINAGSNLLFQLDGRTDIGTAVKQANEIFTQVVTASVCLSGTAVRAKNFYGNGSGLTGISSDDNNVDDAVDDAEYRLVGVAASSDTATLVCMDLAADRITMNAQTGKLTLAGPGIAIGSADVTEAEFEFLDGATAGTAVASKALVVDGSRDVDTINALGIASMSSNWTNASRTVADLGEVTTVDINGGTIDGATIGGNSVAAGSFAAIVGTTGVYSGILKTDDTTDATTNADGSLQTDGGLSVAKAIFNSTAATLAAASGIVTMGSTTAATVSAAGLLTINNATDASNKTTAGAVFDGGIAVAKMAHIGTGLTVDAGGATITAGGLTVTAGGVEVDAGVVNIDDTTAATSKTTGALKVAGGISAQLKGHFGTGLTTDSGGLTVTAGGASITGDVSIIGTTPTLTIGDGGTEDASLIFDGNQQDYHIGVDDTYDALLFGVGSVLGTNTAITIDDDHAVTFGGAVNYVLSSSTATTHGFSGSSGLPSALIVNAGSAATIRLPHSELEYGSPSAGYRLTIKRSAEMANSVTITGSSMAPSAPIDTEVDGIILETAGAAIGLLYDGTEWYIV